MVSVWEFASTFAGPIATVIAAGTAAWITYHLGRAQLQIAAAQKEIAKSQRDIAYDRLKYDLFEKRYEIYLAAKTLIELTSKLAESKNMIDQRAELYELKVKLIEARFFFPPTEAELFRRIAQLAAIHRIAPKTSVTPNEKVENMAANSLIELVEIYEQLPDLLPSLGFAQLTSGGQSDASGPAQRAETTPTDGAAD